MYLKCLLSRLYPSPLPALLFIIVMFISIAVTSIVIYYCHVYIHRRYQHCYLLCHNYIHRRYQHCNLLLSCLYPSPLPALLFIIVMFISIAVTKYCFNALSQLYPSPLPNIALMHCHNYIHRRYQPCFFRALITLFKKKIIIIKKSYKSK